MSTDLASLHTRFQLSQDPSELPAYAHALQAAGDPLGDLILASLGSPPDTPQTDTLKKQVGPKGLGGLLWQNGLVFRTTLVDYTHGQAS